MKHYVVRMDDKGSTVYQSRPIDDWSKAVRRCGLLNDRANRQGDPSVGGYEVVSEQEKDDVGM